MMKWSEIEIFYTKYIDNEYRIDSINTSPQIVRVEAVFEINSTVTFFSLEKSFAF